MSWYNPLTWFAPPGTSVSTENYSSLKKRFFEFNGKTIYFELNNVADIRNAYMTCPPLKAIINIRAQMFVNGEVEIVNKNTKNRQRGSVAKSLRQRLQKPNPLQSWNQFFAQMHIYTDLFGYCPIYKLVPEGFSTDEVSAIWCIPPWIFQIEYTGQWYNQTDRSKIYKAFYIVSNGVRKELPLNQVTVIMDNSIGTAVDVTTNNLTSNLLLPDSRVVSNEYSISNIYAAMKSMNTLITKKGAIGILSNNAHDANGPIKVGDKEKKAVQDDFQKYGTMGEEWQVIITEADLKWQAMTVPVKDMLLHEEIEQDIMRLCDGIGLYFYILSNGKGSTFSNLTQAEKAQYQNRLIPDAVSRLEQLSSFIIPETENARLAISFSHVEALQVSGKDAGIALKAQGDAFQVLWGMGLVTRNQILNAIDFDEVDNEDFKKYIFELPPEKQGIITPGRQNGGGTGDTSHTGQTNNVTTETQ